MSIITSSNQTSQRSLIDDFFIKIEARRNAILQAIDYTQGRKDNELLKISLVELLLGCLDRELQDFHQEIYDHVKYTNSIDELIDIFLQVGIDNLDFYPKLASINYILIAIISTLSNRMQFQGNIQIANEKIYRGLLLLKKLLLSESNFNFHYPIPYREGMIRNIIDDSRDLDKVDERVIVEYIVEDTEGNAAVPIPYNPSPRERKITYKLNNHIEEDDYFELTDLKMSLENDIDEIRQKARAHDIYLIADKLLIFDEEESDSIWFLEIKLNNEKNMYDAVEFSKYIYILSEALQTIGDLEITIEGTGMGSVWIKLKIRIKTLASEIDFKQVIEQAQLYIDAGMHNKPVTELKKVLAESKKLNAETSKILEETIQLKDNANKKKIEELDIYDKYLELRKKALSISKDEEELKMLKLRNLSEISELISRETLNLDSDIQIQINNLGFISKVRDDIIVENSTDIVESLKTTDPKKEIEHSEEGIEEI